MRRSLTPAIFALALVSSGCSAPWASPFSRPATEPGHPTQASSTAVTNPAERLAAPQLPPGLPPIDIGTNEAAPPDMAGVLDKLQQVRELDPTAEQKLVDELRRTPPDTWPLVAEQFRASLAYSRQLSATQPATVWEREPPAQLRSPSERAPTYVIPSDYVSADRVYSVASQNPADVSTHAEQPWPATDGVVPAVAHAAAERWPEENAGGGLASSSPAADEETWQQLVERAADQLSSSVAKSPTTTAEVHQHVSLRILRLLGGDTEKALEPIPHISPVQHDYWSRQLFALATYLDHHSQPDDKRRAAASVAHLDEAVAHLRELGSLSVRNLSFCKNVYGYGAIEAYDADRFSPGEHVSLYVEVENYHSRSTDKGYCTSLGSTYEILNEKGERVGGAEIPDVNDCCRSRRRDFHIQYGLDLPDKLPPGQYRLQLVIKDRQSDKMGNATAAFEIKGLTP